MNSRISITHINNRHSDLLRAISFYAQEIDILKKRLTELAGKNTNVDMLGQLDHYENQFKIQADELERLEHAINEHLTAIAHEAAGSKAGYIDGSLQQQHEQLENQYLQAETIINNIRKEFNRFASNWM